MARFQRGWLRVETRQAGETWVLRFYTTRELDGKRVEHKIAIGLVRELPSPAAAWREVEKQHLSHQINQPTLRGRATFADIACHYLQNELPKRAHTTQYLHRHIVSDYLIPRWGRHIALGIKPLEIEQWLEALRDDAGLANPTRAKIRALMSRIYSHAQKHELIPRDEGTNPLRWVTCETSSEYEAVILTPEQAWTLVNGFPPLERALTILAAATGLRISECLGLQWQDFDFLNHRILVRRTWINRQIGKPKTKSSGKPVPMSDLLAEVVLSWKQETPYSKPEDWVFASSRKKGRQPRTGGIMVQSYLRPAAMRLRILAEHDERRFGFHNLRHSLASFLVKKGTDVKTVQTLMRHANVHTTLNVYAHATSDAKLAAQQQMLEAMRPGMVN